MEYLRAISRDRVPLCVQVVDLYWGVDPEEWDSPELQRLRMKLLEECLKTSAGPCFVVSTKLFPGSSHSLITNNSPSREQLDCVRVLVVKSTSAAVTTPRWSDIAETSSHEMKRSSSLRTCLLKSLGNTVIKALLVFWGFFFLSCIFRVSQCSRGNYSEIGLEMKKKSECLQWVVVVVVVEGGGGGCF